MSEQREHHAIPRFELRHRLARSLEEAGLKPEDIAPVLGKNVTTIRNYLRGRTVPDRATIIAWALRCGVDFDWLNEGIEPTDTGPDGGSSPTKWYAGTVVRLPLAS